MAKAREVRAYSPQSAWSQRASTIILVACACVIVGWVTRPLWYFLISPARWSHGEFLLRDMVVLRTMPLTLSAVGFGDLPARNAPQDGVLGVLSALFSVVVPGVTVPVVVAAFLVCAAAWGAWASLRIVRAVTREFLPHHPTACVSACVMAMSLVVGNPFVVERLEQGQWSLAAAGWLVPVVWVARWRARALAQWLMSLTPTGAILGTLVAICVARSWRARWWHGVWGLIVSLPWVVPSVMQWGKTNAVSGSDAVRSAAFSSFAMRAELHLPSSFPASETVSRALTALGWGGIWNANAASPQVNAFTAVLGCCVCAVIVWMCLRRRMRVFFSLLCMGLGALCLCVMMGDQSVAHISSIVAGWFPGWEIFRDSQKIMLLSIPLSCVGSACLCAGRWGSLGRGWVRRVCAVVVCVGVLLPISGTLDALAPVSGGSWSSLADRARGRSVLMPEASTIVALGDRVVVNPYAKAVDLVDPGELVVDGVVVDPMNPRYMRALAAWSTHDTAALAVEGVGVVVTPDAVVDVENAVPAPNTERYLGISLSVVWLLSPLCAGCSGVLLRCCRSVRSGVLR